MSTFIGKNAELAAAKYLESIGFTILALNWRNRYCEIDIIARKKNRIFNSPTLHFVEVKYRKSDSHGSGLSYITEKKLQQMIFGAELYVHEHSVSLDVQLDAIEVTRKGEEWKFNFIENITM